MCPGVHTCVHVHLPEQVCWSSSSVLPRGQWQLRCWSGRDRQMSLHPPLSTAHGSSEAAEAAKEAVKFTLLFSLDQRLILIQGFAIKYYSIYWERKNLKQKWLLLCYYWKIDLKKKKWLPAFWNKIKTHKRLKRMPFRTVINCLKRSELVHVRWSPLFETAQVGNDSWFPK